MHPTCDDHAFVDDFADTACGQVRCQIQRVPDFNGDGLFGGCRVNRQSPFGKPAGFDQALHHIGVRHGRGPAAIAEGGRVWLCVGTFGANLQATLPIEPPSAPISIVSVTGMRTAMPEPLMKRADRGWKAPIRHSLAAAPPCQSWLRSGHRILRRSVRQGWPRRPDRTRPTGSAGGWPFPVLSCDRGPSS